MEKIFLNKQNFNGMQDEKNRENIMKILFQQNSQKQKQIRIQRSKIDITSYE